MEQYFQQRHGGGGKDQLPAGRGGHEEDPRLAHVGEAGVGGAHVHQVQAGHGETTRCSRQGVEGCSGGDT